MNGKSFFVDLTKCTACRGCQVACKQWKKLPAEKTRNVGSHQNPQDLSAVTLKLVRFKEEVNNGKVDWFFFPDQCRHCIEAPCVMVSEVEGAIIQDPVTGAVIYTEKTAQEDFETIRGACPYDIPRQDPKTKVIFKCDMCSDRVAVGMLPACVQTCPTGAMNFGDREDMLALAEKRLKAISGKYPEATLVDADNVRTIYLAAEAPEKYHNYLMSEAAPISPLLSRKEMLAKLTRPFRTITAG